MAWLVPSIIATMSGTAVLAFCYFYLYHQDNKQFLKIWAISWTIYFTRYIFMLGIVLWKKTPLLLICNQSASLVSGILLLYGSYLFVNKKFPRPFYYLTALGLFWIIISTAYNFSFMLMSLPTFSFLAGIYIWTGILFLKSKESYQMESRAVGLTFVIWGAHKANYPFLRPVLWFAPWGYLIAAILEFMVALGLLMTYFRKTKDELHSNEMKLKENQKRLVSAQRIAKVGDWSWDIETNELIWSEETFRIFGQNPKTFEISVEAFEKAIHPDDYQDFITKREFVLSNNMDIDIEHRIVLPDGSIRYVHEITTTIKNSQSEVVKALGTVQDITDRKQAEEALRESNKTAHQFFSESSAGAFFMMLDEPVEWSDSVDKEKVLDYVFDHQRITKINRAMLDQYLASEKDFLFMTPKQLFAHDLEHGRLLWRKMFDQGFLDIESDERRFDGSQMWIIGSYRCMFDEQGRIIGHFGTQLDITSRKQSEAEREKLQAQLNQAQKLESVGRLAGGVAHDFNNMLGVILGHTELALLQADEDNDLVSDLKEIQTAATRSADITKQLLAFARKQTISPKQLDLNDTVESMLNMLRRLIGEDIDLVWKPDAHIWPVKMDPSQIDQVLVNLCINAKDAIAGVGKLTIETGRKTFDEDYCSEHQGFVPGDFVLLAISDNGCGMDKDTLDNLFEPFFTTKEVGKGTGLGLATVYGIVKQNNGFINVYSEPGQGSTFKIYLPRLVADEDTDKIVPEEKAAAGGTETILLVEDEASILRMTCMMLERKGYTVLSAATPTEAMEKAKNHSGSIDLLMTDVIMPEMNGRDLAGQITDLYPDIRLLFMSGYTANVIVHQGILDKGVAFIQKPFSMADMTMKVRDVLDMSPDKNQG